MDILVLEDDYPIAEFIAEVLYDEGYTVRIAPNVAFGLAEIQDSVPSLILLDLNLPTRNDSALFLDYWRTSNASHVPIIVISAASHVPSENLLDVSAFLVKPFELTDLLDLVSQYAGTRSPNSRSS